MALPGVDVVVVVVVVVVEPWIIKKKSSIAKLSNVSTLGDVIVGIKYIIMWTTNMTLLIYDLNIDEYITMIIVAFSIIIQYYR